MCGRYSLAAPSSQITEAFELETENLLSEKRYNIAPTQFAPFVYINEENKRTINKTRFGFIPSWWAHTKETLFKPPLGSTFNARDDKLFSSGYWKKSIIAKRALLPATGFYEWQKSDGEKLPYYFRLKNENELFAFGAVYSIWKVPDNYKFFQKSKNDAIFTAAIITTEANENTKAIGHLRHPLIIDRANYDAWLNHDLSEAELKSLIKPFLPDKMIYFRVSKAVNSVKNESEDLIRKI
ncbi:MAG: SOS response-associated peptidase [Spirochaetia bacterium]|nr:SOS response-associated peptidase [Spirochaetia bacterium]